MTIVKSSGSIVDVLVWQYPRKENGSVLNVEMEITQVVQKKDVDDKAEILCNLTM